VLVLPLSRPIVIDAQSHGETRFPPLCASVLVTTSLEIRVVSIRYLFPEDIPVRFRLSVKTNEPCGGLPKYRTNSRDAVMTKPLSCAQPAWVKPRAGYANGVAAPPPAHRSFIAGQIGWDAPRVLPEQPDFGAQAAPGAGAN